MALKPGGGPWGAISDERLKRDIHAYEDGLEAVLEMDPVWFKYVEELDQDGASYVGVLAQDIQDIAPYMVDEIDVDVPAEAGEPYLGLDATALPYMLVNAVQEQQQIIDSQQRAIEEQRELTVELREELHRLTERLEALER